MALQPLTPEQLTLAFRHLARPGWPTLLADALAHRIYGPAIRGLARNFGRRGVCQAAPAHSLPRPPAPPTPPSTLEHMPRGPHSKAKGPATALTVWPTPTSRRTATTAGRFDAKKAAAGDFDEVAA